MFEILDELEEIICISDLETYEIVYLNKAGRDLYHCENPCGKKCYAVLQNLSEPCGFCKNDLLKKEKYIGRNYVWEVINRVTGKYYLLKDRLIEYNGKLLRMEVAFDVDSERSVAAEVRRRLAVENCLVECVRKLVSRTSVSEGVNSALATVGDFYDADRAYVFQRKGEHYSNTFEWCRKGVEPEIDKLALVERDSVACWTQILTDHRTICVSDVETKKGEWEKEYEMLAWQNIRSIIVTALYDESGELGGFIGVDNPALNGSDPTLLETLSSFVNLILENGEMQDRLMWLSYFDAMTGVYNSNRYSVRVQELASEDAPLGVAFVDVNGLKRANDSYGHEYGNGLIVKTVNILKKHFPTEKIFRAGGDEFVVLYDSVMHADFMDAVAAVRAEFVENGGLASIGGNWSRSSADIMTAKNLADTQMYLDKDDYYRNIDDGSDRPVYLKDLLRSLEKDEFEVYFQPVFNCPEMRLGGAEALVRHASPKLGLVRPDRFIKVLENERLIHYLDQHVFEKCCAYKKEWNEKYGASDFRVSVNFSRLTLLQPAIATTLEQIAARYGVDPNEIIIEMTETVGEVSVDKVMSVLNDLKQKNFRIAVDDFGSRYANFSLLTAAEFDYVKIDRRLLESIAQNPRNSIIFNDIISTCRRLGYGSVVEGVETKKQLAYTKKCKATYVQGYLFDKPLPAPDFVNKYLKTINE